MFYCWNGLYIIIWYHSISYIVRHNRIYETRVCVREWWYKGTHWFTELKNYAHDSNFFLFCCVLVHFDICLTLQWRHNGRDSVSNHQPRECLLSRLIRQRSKKTSKPRATGLCAGNSPETGEFPAQRAGNAENVSIWWRHHEAPSLEFTRLPRCQWYIPEKYGYLSHEVAKN